MQLVVAALLVGSAAAFSVQGQVRPSTTRRCVSPRAAGPLDDDIWAKSPSVKVQGDTLKTWDIGEETTQRVQLAIKSDGRPINTNCELWVTPSYIPFKFRVYSEDGRLRPVNAVIETPVHPKTVAVYNTGPIEFPFEANIANISLAPAYESLSVTEPEKVQGGKVTSYTFEANVNSVQILLKTDERNMKAKIELTQGPNQVKQIVELYASVGYKNPFYVVIQTPGSNNAIRVINENTVEFPFNAWVLPYETGSTSDSEPIIGGGGW